MFVFVCLFVCLFECLGDADDVGVWLFYGWSYMGWEVGVGVLNGGGKRVGVMLVCGKSFLISAKKGGWVLQMVQKIFSP